MEKDLARVNNECITIRNNIQKMEQNNIQLNTKISILEEHIQEKGSELIQLQKEVEKV